MYEAHICSIDNSVIVVKEQQASREKGSIDFISENPVNAFPEGLVVLALANQPESIQMEDGIAEIPEGATVTVHDDQDNLLCQIEVHRNGTPPMIHYPGEVKPENGKKIFHPIDGGTYFSGIPVPDVIHPKAVIWCHD